MNFKVGFFDDADQLLVRASGDGGPGGLDPGPRQGCGAGSEPTVSPRASPGARRRIRRRRQAAARAQTRPPIARTSRAHTNRPMPAPAVDAGSRRGAVEQVEQPLRLVRLDARAIVADAHRHLVVAGPDVHDDLDRRALPTVLGGVRQQVADDLLEVGRVGDDRRQPGGTSTANVDARPALLLRRDDAPARPAGGGPAPGPGPPSLSPNRLSATTSSTSRLSRSASSATSARISRRVASSRPLSSRDSTRAPPKIVVTGVRSSCDRTPMKVSRTASRWRCSVTSRRTRIVSPPVSPLGRAVGRPGRSRPRSSARARTASGSTTGPACVPSRGALRSGSCSSARIPA